MMVVVVVVVVKVVVKVFVGDRRTGGKKSGLGGREVHSTS